MDYNSYCPGLVIVLVLRICKYNVIDFINHSKKFQCRSSGFHKSTGKFRDRKTIFKDVPL